MTISDEYNLCLLEEETGYVNMHHEWKFQVGQRSRHKKVSKRLQHTRYALSSDQRNNKSSLASSAVETFLYSAAELRRSLHL